MFTSQLASNSTPLFPSTKAITTPSAAILLPTLFALLPNFTRNISYDSFVNVLIIFLVSNERKMNRE